MRCSMTTPQVCKGPTRYTRSGLESSVSLWLLRCGRVAHGHIGWPWAAPPPRPCDWASVWRVGGPLATAPGLRAWEGATSWPCLSFGLVRRRRATVSGLRLGAASRLAASRPCPGFGSVRRCFATVLSSGLVRPPQLRGGRAVPCGGAPGSCFCPHTPGKRWADCAVLGASSGGC